MQSDVADLSPKKPSRYQPPRYPFDRRSKSARRYAALIAQFTLELGGNEGLNEGAKAMVAQLAALILQGEAMQAQIVRGEPVDAEQLVRIGSLQTRLMRMLGLASKPKGTEAEKPTLDSYLKGRAA